MGLTSIVYFLLLAAVSALGHDRPLVTTALGTVRGYHKQSYGDRTFSAFEGIPYAKPPVGDLRFREPQAADPWIGVWDATVTYECAQITFTTHNPVGDEDCLYLNVYVPNEQPTSKENLDVIVYIHGGGFMIGSPDFGVPTYVMDRDVIYVSLNYRLNIFGFLSTQDDVVPGNNGLKDQAMALQWVQNNIEQFGGNSQSVTITGLSAGGASVHYHYFSPLSKGLFHRGFSQSGTVLCPWALQKGALEKTKKLAVNVGCNNHSKNKMIECMRQRSTKQLAENLKNFVIYSEYPIATFGPVIEKDAKTAFLTEHPYKLLADGNINDVPWITSITAEEGLMFHFTMRDKLDDVNERWYEILPHVLEFSYTAANSDKLVIAIKIKEYYFGQEKLSHNNIDSFIKLLGDRLFVLPFEEAARLQAKVSKSSIYAYLYGYNGDQGFSKSFGLNMNGVTHGDDGSLLFPMRVNGFTRQPISLPSKLSDSDEFIKEMFLDMVTSIAENGKPKVQEVTWEPVTDSGDFRYLFIEKPNQITMAYKKEMAPIEFWNSLPLKENANFISIRDEL